MSVSALSDEKAKSFPLNLSSGVMSLSDAGDTFADYKAEPYSPSPTSSRSPSPGHPPGLPHTSPTWQPGLVMDIPSVLHLDIHERPVGLQPMLDIASAPRHPTDTPSGVHSNTDDIV
jgi:hypothetical protein